MNKISLLLKKTTAIVSYELYIEKYSIIYSIIYIFLCSFTVFVVFLQVFSIH